LAACYAQLPEEIQVEMDDLLDRRREGDLQPPESVRLEDLLKLYRRGLVRKAQALNVAVARGLKPRLN
jgi:hypothetical protein